MYTPKFCYIDKDHGITVRELKIVLTHVYNKILIYWQRSWNNSSRTKNRNNTCIRQIFAILTKIME